jgi:hypothetical protein
MRLKPTQLRAVVDAVRVALAEERDARQIEAMLDHRFGIEPLARCRGAAHENPHIDNCMTCAPRWGWTGEKV